jgi:hypothetical protein
LVGTGCTVRRRVTVQQHPPSIPAKVQCQDNVGRLLRL